MRIGLIRHGETDWNAQQLLQGTTDIPLNERGIEQAEDAARLLRGSGWSQIVCSPLGRTRHTAQIISAGIGLGEPIIVPDLIERSFGALEGESVYREDGSRMPIDHPSVEPVEHVVARTLNALKTIAEAHANEDVLAITHGSVVRLTLDMLLPWQAPHISNLAISVIETDSSKEHGFIVRSANGYPVYQA